MSITDIFRNEDAEDVVFRYKVKGESRIHHIILSIYSDEALLTDIVDELIDYNEVLSQGIFEMTSAYEIISKRAAYIQDSKPKLSWRQGVRVEASDITVYLPHIFSRIIRKLRESYHVNSEFSIRNPKSEDGKSYVKEYGYNKSKGLYFADIYGCGFDSILIESKTIEGLETGIEKTYERLSNGFHFEETDRIIIIDDDSHSSDDDDEWDDGNWNDDEWEDDDWEDDDWEDDDEF